MYTQYTRITSKLFEDKTPVLTAASLVTLSASSNSTAASTTATNTSATVETSTSTTAITPSSTSSSLLTSSTSASSSTPESIILLCGEWPNGSRCTMDMELASTITGGNNATSFVSTLPPDNILDMDLELADNENWSLERIVSMIVPVFFGVIGFSGLIGNALVILVVVVNQQMRSTTNLLIINLAVSDILFVIFCIPFTATDYILPEWPFGNLWCKFVQYMIVVTCHCSVYTLVFMSYDRFLAVVHPVTSISLRTEWNAILVIILAWILILLTAIPVALAHSVRVYRFRGHRYTACVFSSDEESWNLVAFQVSFFLSSYVVPLTLISFLYMGILTRLWRTTPGCEPSATARKGKRRVTRMVVIVVLAFAICWLPIHIVLVLKALNLYPSVHFTIIIQIIAHVLAYTNSCINPILYAFLSENFRKAFRKFIWCGSIPLIAGNQQMTRTTRTTALGNGTSNVDML